MKPYVMVGETGSRALVRQLMDLKWGRFFIEKPPTPYPFERWGFDNGAFRAYQQGRKFPDEQFTRRLDRAARSGSDPLIAVCPDIVAGGGRSLDFSLEWRIKLGRCGPDWPWYLAVQDGMDIEDVARSMHLFDGIFLGGTDRFKAKAWRWCQLAHKHQKPFHYGRASTPAKLVSAFKIGADSCDSAFPLWTAERMRIFTARWQGLEEQMAISYEPDPCDSTQRPPEGCHAQGNPARRGL